MSNKMKLVILCLILLLLANLMMSHGFTNINSLEGFIAYLNNQEDIGSFHPALHRETIKNMLNAPTEPFAVSIKDRMEQGNKGASV